MSARHKTNMNAVILEQSGLAFGPVFVLFSQMNVFILSLVFFIKLQAYLNDTNVEGILMCCGKLFYSIKYTQF